VDLELLWASWIHSPIATSHVDVETSPITPR